MIYRALSALVVATALAWLGLLAIEDHEATVPFAAIGGGLLGLFVLLRRSKPDPAEVERLAAQRLESQGEAAAAFGLEGRIIEAGDHWRRLCGRAPTLASAFAALAEGDGEIAKRLAAVAERAASGQRAEAEIGQGIGASARRLRVMVSPDRAGAATGLARILILNALPSARDARLDGVLDAAGLGLVAVDGGGRVVEANAGFSAWIGREAVEIAARRPRLADLTGGKDGAEGGRWSLAGPEGKREVLATPLGRTGADGVLYFVVTDLSVERQWGDALVRAEGRFHRLVDEAPLGIAAVDAAGRVADANHALAVLAGVGEADLPGLPFLDLLGEPDRAPTRDYLDAMRRGASGNDPLDIRAFGKPPRPVQILAGRPSRERGDVLLFVVDMSERRNLEQRVLHAQKMQAIGQMAGGVAHDFNNLLTAMIGHCDLLLERHPETDPAFADLQQIKQNAARAASLVRQLLAFSRRQTLRPETLDPA